MIYFLAIHESFLNQGFTFIFSFSLLNVAIRASLSPSLCVRHQFFLNDFFKKQTNKLSAKLHQMANAILPNSEMEVRDRKPYKLCLLLLCQTGAQSLSNCKIIQRLSDVLNYCKTNIDISIKTVKCTPGYAGKIKARAFLSWAPMM